MISKKLILIGFVLMSLMTSGCSMKSMMIQERVSPYSVDMTVSKIQENAKAAGWNSPAVRNMKKSIKKHGGQEIKGSVRIVELCNASHAGNILADDSGRYAAVLMPCAVAVYTKDDNQTYVANMRAGLMGTMMGGVVSDVMNEVDVDQKKMLNFLP